MAAAADGAMVPSRRLLRRRTSEASVEVADGIAGRRPHAKDASVVWDVGDEEWILCNTLSQERRALPRRAFPFHQGVPGEFALHFDDNGWGILTDDEDTTGFPRLSN